jgi:acetyltransferase EpsM
MSGVYNSQADRADIEIKGVSMPQKIVIIGGRGNGTVIASTIEDCKEAGQNIECLGFLNDNEREINGYPVVGPIRGFDLGKIDPDIKFIFAMSNVKQSRDRYEMLQSMNIPKHRYATIVHPTATVSKSAKLGYGAVIMPQCIVSPDVVVGDHSQLYGQSFVGHDSSLEEMVFIANNASVGGRVLVKTGAHIGSNSSLRERITIGEYSVVGLGAVVLKDVPEGQIFAGNPAKQLQPGINRQ